MQEADGISHKEYPVVVHQYGLLQPLDWDQDVIDELWRCNRLWNNLVEIENRNREQYREILGKSPEFHGTYTKIKELEAIREECIHERNKRRASVRSKKRADTADIDARLLEIRETLKPLYGESKILSAAARIEMKDELVALELNRREQVKQARQNSGLFWGNYNAVISAYDVARSKALKEGATLRFHRFEGDGRLVNQIQGGLTIADLMAGKSSQVQLVITGASRGRQTGILRVKAFVCRDEKNKPVPRYVSFPIILHRPIPGDASVKMVAVNIKKLGGKYRYSVTFTSRSKDNGEPPSGTGAAGINIGWKRVKDGFRVATAAFSNSETECLILPNKWMERMEYVSTLQGRLDESMNDILPKIKSAIDDLPAWREGVEVEMYPARFHRRLSAVLRAPKLGAPSLLRLLWDVKLQLDAEPNTLPALHDIANEMELWRKKNKRIMMEMANLREKLLCQRKDMYRVYSKRISDRAGLVMLDATSYKDAAMVNKKDGGEPDLPAPARTNRVLVAPYELRLSIGQALAKRGGKLVKYEKKINQCHECGATNDGFDIIVTCHNCGGTYDIDENAAKNLMAAAIIE